MNEWLSLSGPSFHTKLPYSRCPVRQSHTPVLYSLALDHHPLDFPWFPLGRDPQEPAHFRIRLGSVAFLLDNLVVVPFPTWLTHISCVLLDSHFTLQQFPSFRLGTTLLFSLFLPQSFTLTLSLPFFLFSYAVYFLAICQFSTTILFFVVVRLPFPRPPSFILFSGFLRKLPRRAFS